MKKLIVPSSWYFCIGYFSAILFICYQCSSLLWNCYCNRYEMTESVRMAYVITVALLFSVLLLLIVTRAAHLAAVFVFSERGIVRFVPFRTPRRVRYNDIHFVKVSCVIYSNYTMGVKHLFLASEILNENDLRYIAPKGQKRVIISLRISKNGCTKLCQILPAYLSKMIMSEIQSFSLQCKKFKKKQRNKNTK